MWPKTMEKLKKLLLNMRVTCIDLASAAEKSAYFEVTIMLLLNVAENNGKVEEVINKHESNLHRSGFRSTFNLNSGGTH